MNGDGVKFKTSLISPPEKAKEDSYSSKEDVPVKSTFNGDGANYNPSDKNLSQWKNMNYGHSKAASIAGFPNVAPLLDALGPWCKEVNENKKNMQTATSYSKPFQAKSWFDMLRIKYESAPKDTSLNYADEMAEKLDIPAFNEIYDGLGKTAEYAQNFYIKKLSVLDELIENAKLQIENQKDAISKNTGKELLKKLEDTKAYAEEQLTLASKAIFSEES